MQLIRYLEDLFATEEEAAVVEAMRLSDPEGFKRRNDEYDRERQAQWKAELDDYSRRAEAKQMEDKLQAALAKAGEYKAIIQLIIGSIIFILLGNLVMKGNRNAPFDGLPASP